MPFEPGYAGGPGPIPAPEDIKAARRMSKLEIERVMNKFLYMPFNEILKLGDGKNDEAKDLTTVEMLVVRVLIKAISKGDYIALDSLLNRLIGKVRDEIKIDASINYHSEIISMIEKIEYNSFLSNSNGKEVLGYGSEKEVNKEEN